MMTVLDVNYDIAPFMKIDPFMARLLSCTYVFISFVIVLNLIIAMITDTFKRVFSYAQEHAAMERAKTILNIEDSMREKSKKLYWEYVRTQCSPLIMDRLNRQGQTIFHEMVRMNDRIRETHQLVELRFGKQFGENRKSTMEDMLKFANEIVKNYEDSKEMLGTIFQELRRLEDIVMPRQPIDNEDRSSKNEQEDSTTKSKNLASGDQAGSASETRYTLKAPSERKYSIKSDPGDFKERVKQKLKSMSKSSSQIGVREKSRKERSLKKTAKGEDEEYQERPAGRTEDYVRRKRSKSAGNISRTESRAKHQAKSLSSRDVSQRKARY